MAIVLTSYYRHKPGGFCTRLLRAMRALAERGHVVHYLALEEFPVDHPNCVFHLFPWPVRWADNYAFWAVFHLFAPFLLLFLAVRYRVDRLFAFSPTYGFMLQLARLARRTPLVVFLRADSIENHRLLGRPGWLIRLETWIERLGIAGSRIYTVSAALASEVRRRHLNSTVDVLRNDLPECPLADRALVRNGKVLQFGCVGVLEPRKRQAFLLGVLGKIGGMKPWRLHLFGDGPDRSKLEMDAVGLGIDKQVFFHGWLPRESLWSKVECLLFPSRHEGAPNAVLEALACGVPVIASDTPEHREILPRECLVPADDPEAWRHVIEKMLDERESRMRKLLNAQEEARKRLVFDWNDMIARRIVGECES